MSIEDSLPRFHPRRLVSLLALSATLSALAACAPAEPEASPDSTQQAHSALGTVSGAPQVSYEFPVNDTALADAVHESTAVAAGDGIYLVVWMEYVTTGTPPDIKGVRVRASDGARLDASPLLIATGSNVQYRPSVAFDGTNFLVIYEEIRSAPGVYGVRVRASDGAVLDASPLYISRTPMNGYNLPQQSAAVAFDGTNYLVTWNGYYWNGQTVVGGVQAIRVRPSDGSCIEATSTFLMRDGANPRVAYADGSYLVTWTRNRVAEAMRISPATGLPVDSTIITLGANSTTPFTGVAAQGGEFLAAWIGTNNTLFAQRVRASDGAKLGAAESVVGAEATAAPEVTFDGVDYRIIWEGRRQNVVKVLTTRVSSQGVVAADAEQVLAEVGNSATGRFRGGSIASVGSGRILTAYTKLDDARAKTRGRMRLLAAGQSSVSSEFAVSAAQGSDAGHLGSAVAAGNGIYLVVWSDFSGGNRPDIVGVRVRASDGARLDMLPVRIATGISSVDTDPAVAFDGTNFLVVWQQIDAYPLVYGARVRASDGAVLDQTPVFISRAFTNGYSLPQFSPAVAFDGTNYLVTWNGYYYSYGSVYDGILGIRVRTDGTLIETYASVISQGGANARVAYADGHYLVSWNENQNIEAARVDAATGRVLDWPGRIVTAAAGNDRYPAVAARHEEFLVTWIGGDNGLKARRVRASDGAMLDEADIAVAPSASSYPAVTFDGMDYRIAWPDSSGGVRRVLSRRVSSQGVVAADAELLISELHASSLTDRGGIAAMGPGNLLISYVNYSASVSKNRTMLRLVSDAHEPEPCTSGLPSLVLNGGSPLTLECGAGLQYSDPGARAFDGCGNPIPVQAYNTGADSSGPGPLMSYEGSYSVSYVALDALGNTVSAVRTVNVEDRTAPVLQLIGPAFMTHTCGSQWEDPGVQAIDACYGNVSDQVGHTGEVNGWAPGTYTVTYWLTDSGGNSATPVSRTVEVANCPW
jgi:hypothetical protein